MEDPQQQNDAEPNAQRQEEENDDAQPATISDQQQHHHHHKSQSFSGDGASPGKIFIGGLARETTIAQFVDHFGKYGEFTDSVIMKDRKTGQPRGFGFITYADPSIVDQVIQDTHVINGKQVEIKRTIPRSAQWSKDFKTKKIFVGGIPGTVNEDELKEYFLKFGEVVEHQIMREHATSRSRGFGFVAFNSENVVDELLSKGNKIEIAGTRVEIKKAEPRKPHQPPPSSKQYNGPRRTTFGSGYGDAYDGYGGGSFGGDGAYRSGGLYGSRSGAYGGGRGYGMGEFGEYGGNGGSGVGPYRGDPSLGYSGRYGGGLTRGYDLGGGYGGGPRENYSGYGGGPSESYDGYGGGGSGSRYGGSYNSAMGGGYGVGASSSFYGSSRGRYSSGAERYHPYGR